LLLTAVPAGAIIRGPVGTEHPGLMSQINTPEIVLNLWYVCDEMGAIYSLRAKCYVEIGDDQQKLEFLQIRATKDYLVATPFAVPENFYTTVEGKSALKLAVVLLKALEEIGGAQVLFEDAFVEMEKRLPGQTKLTIGGRPLVCITPLLCDGDELIPQISEQQRLETRPV